MSILSPTNTARTIKKEEKASQVSRWVKDFINAKLSMADSVITTTTAIKCVSKQSRNPTLAVLEEIVVPKNICDISGLTIQHSTV